ncbi:MAG: 16S rRNA (cytosine(1402)-N(4))-methyltransferase RsmH [Streptococcaceae bacterium]|jgi:16S rRNA (cytosine1402-N4)-methyltransferase|nr:16S rRNA (cytosine(1402)-N(4))-methyltransferase RsmH [Streptococcaceae bacterium]
MNNDFHHYTVMLKEAVNGLNVKANGIYVDCTLGAAGHSKYLLLQLGKNGHLYVFDQDITAIKHAKKHLAFFVNKGMVTFIKSNFRNLKVTLNNYDLTKIDGFIYDLGVSSAQLDQAKRGFSYQKNATLDMRMDLDIKKTAYNVVNLYSYNDLVKIFYRYGEEKFSKQIARKIEQARANKPINTTKELVELIKKSIPAAARRQRGHPAKRIFQAIRIEVNDELDAIKDSLEQAVELLNVNGRISVITFHSLEDKIVKTIFKKYSTIRNLPPNLPVLSYDQPILKMINRKPIIASEDELKENNRSRSAKLRIVERIRN